MNKYLIIIIILGICFGTFNAGLTQTSLAQTSSDLTQERGEITMFEKGIEILKKNLNEVLVIWKRIHLKATGYWKENILPKIQEWFEKKKPEIKEEFKKEKEEMNQEIRDIISDSWQWLKDLIK